VYRLSWLRVVNYNHLVSYRIFSCDANTNGLLTDNRRLRLTIALASFNVFLQVSHFQDDEIH